MLALFAVVSMSVGGAGIAAALPPAPERPHDPWVFRSVLDKRARMVTLALHERLWVGYDATNGALYKAWDGRGGGVKFDGAVYTTVHGPQPTSQGDSHAEGPPGAAWRIVMGETAIDVSPIFRGYRVEDGRAVIVWEFDLGEEDVRVHESPEARPQDDGRIGFERVFTIEGELPEGTTIYVAVNQEFARARENGLTTTGSAPPGVLAQAWDRESGGDVRWVGLNRGGTMVMSIFGR